MGYIERTPKLRDSPAPSTTEDYIVGCLVTETHTVTETGGRMKDEELDLLHNAELKEAFDEFDKDGSGAINSQELLGIMRAMGQNPTEDEVLNLMLEADLDGNGTIEFPEFLELMKETYGTDDQESDLREAFKIFDRNRDGFIDIRELKKVSMMLGSQLNPHEIDELMAEADVDGNGKLDYSEFVKMLLSC